MEHFTKTIDEGLRTRRIRSVVCSGCARKMPPSSGEEIGRRRGASNREAIPYFIHRHWPPPDVDRDKLIAAIHDEPIRTPLPRIPRS